MPRAGKFQRARHLVLDGASRVGFPLAPLIKAGRFPLISLVIQPDGHIRDRVLLVSSGDPRADAAAQRFLRKARYREPATLDGVPTRMFLAMQVEFRIPRD